MTSPKYKIEQENTGGRTLWVIKLARNCDQGNRGKFLSYHTSQAEAHETAQRYVAEDRDFAMEGR